MLKCRPRDCQWIAVVHTCLGITGRVSLIRIHEIPIVVTISEVQFVDWDWVGVLVLKLRDLSRELVRIWTTSLAIIMKSSTTVIVWNPVLITDHASTGWEVLELWVRNFYSCSFHRVLDKRVQRVEEVFEFCILQCELLRIIKLVRIRVLDTNQRGRMSKITSL